MSKTKIEIPGFATPVGVRPDPDSHDPYAPHFLRDQGFGFDLPPRVRLTRLRRWAKILRGLRLGKTKVFNMSRWACLLADAEGRYHFPKCGTMACALGWAGLDAGFRRAGLKTNPMNESVRLTGFDDACTPVEAAEKFFGLSPGEARWITLMYGAPEGKRAALAVARKIEAVADRYEKLYKAEQGVAK